MHETIIQVNKLGKLYRIGESAGYRTLRDAITRAATAPFRALQSRPRGHSADPILPRENGHIWALRNVSFEVRKGEAIGIIGPNGADKSTLLKILSRITEPTEGWAKVRGSLGSLLEVGTGFHPELTGRENIYVNGAILGMTMAEIAGKFDEIGDFAEIEKFINTPVEHFSDGMRVKLGSTIAAHLEPGILVVSEVLSVGDKAFQQIYLCRMDDVTSHRRMVFLVGHILASIENLCETVILLDHAQVVTSGRACDVMGQHISRLDEAERSLLAGRTDCARTGRLQFADFTVSGTVHFVETAQCWTPTSPEIAYEGTPPLRNVEIYLVFYPQLGTRVRILNDTMVGKQSRELPRNESFICQCEKLPLIPGNNPISMLAAVDDVIANHVGDAVSIHITGGASHCTGRFPDASDRTGLIAFPDHWDVVDQAG